MNAVIAVIGQLRHRRSRAIPAISAFPAISYPLVTIALGIHYYQHIYRAGEGPQNSSMRYVRRTFVALTWLTAAILLARRVADDPVARLRNLGAI